MRTPEWIKTVAVMSVCTLLPAFAAPEVGPETGERDFEKTAVFDAEQEDAAITAFRLFAEPLLPLGEVTTAEENAALRSALQQFSARTKPDDAGALQAFVDSHPQSAWRPTLTVALAQFYFDQGYFTRATALWEEAWALTKAFTEGRGKAVGDLVVGELAMMQARVGNYERVEAVLREIHARPVVGSATERIASARDGLALMKLRPESSFKCGPYAVGSIFVAQQGEHAFPPAVLAAESTVDGTSLVQVAELAKQVGLDYQMAFREPGAPLLVPSVVNWKATHFAAIVREEAGRYLVKDPTFLQDFWVTADAVDDESSGYFLVPRGHGCLIRSHSFPVGYAPHPDRRL